MSAKQSTATKKVKNYKKNILKRQKEYLARRPHRSFRLTRRRDYKRTWSMPGYWSFTNEVRALLWSHRLLFTKFILLYAVVSFLIIGLLSQDNYQLLDSTVNKLGGDVVAGELSGIVQNIAIFAGVMTGAFSQTLTQVQQAYSALLLLLGWLTTVWLLRQIMASHKNIKLRDGLYNSGAPLISTFVVSIIVLIQLLPFAIALIAYTSAYTVDLFSNVFLSVCFWVVELLLIVLSVYWLTSSLLAMVVVTLPGMYPYKALKAAGDMVVGRRLRILYRFAWLGLSIVVIWAIVVLPLIAFSRIPLPFDVPIVPIAVLLLSAFTVLWSSAYTYLLYRKLVSDGK